ncbi:hypothetical protein BC832DRAFT_594847 [Gaertneriomyces semiglobifer]|nr:hypothetical protein BC832DRAFT_594847 [Gaertneriomyces semiglobifer]
MSHFAQSLYKVSAMVHPDVEFGSPLSFNMAEAEGRNGASCPSGKIRPIDKYWHRIFGDEQLRGRLHHVGGNSLNIIRHMKLTPSPPPPPVGIRMIGPTTPKLTESALGLVLGQHRAFHTARNNGASGSSRDKGGDSGGSRGSKGSDGDAPWGYMNNRKIGIDIPAVLEDPEEPDPECPEDQLEREGWCVDEPNIPWVAGDVPVEPLSKDEYVSEGGYEGDIHSPVETLVIELLEVRSGIAV